MVSLNEVAQIGARADRAADHDANKLRLGKFESFCREDNDELDALKVHFGPPNAQSFSADQVGWLTLIRDLIVVDPDFRLENIDETLFAERFGLGRVWGLLVEELDGVLDESIRERVA